MFVSISAESVPFSMVTALPLTSLAKIEHGGYKILRGCGVGKSRDRRNEIQFNKGNFLNASVTGKCPKHQSGKRCLKSEKWRISGFQSSRFAWGYWNNLESKTICDFFLDWVVKHFIHMIFFFGIKNPLHHKEGKEPDVGSQKSSLTARDSPKSRNSRISVLKQMPVPLSLYHSFYLWSGILLF